MILTKEELKTIRTALCIIINEPEQFLHEEDKVFIKKCESLEEKITKEQRATK